MMYSDLLDAVEAARQAREYLIYLEVRAAVLRMLAHSSARKQCPSDYWEEELAGFDYMLDASPLIIRKLREHCYHLTGLRSYDYRHHHAHRSQLLARKLRALRAEDTDGLFVPESPLLGGFGHIIDGVLVNLDTLKFYEALIAMSKAGVLASVDDSCGERRMVMEIGAGWGGFAYQFRTLFPNVTYIIVDLPQTLLFSAVYIGTLFPSASMLICDDSSGTRQTEDLSCYDFVFLPHYVMANLQLHQLDLAINMVSFQEMTSEQVGQYAQTVYDLGCPMLYSLNRDRSPHNEQLTSVSSIVSEFYDLTEVHVLDVSYPTLTALEPRHSIRDVGRAVLRRLGRRQPALDLFAYRHLVGTRRHHTG